jgi:hypothetical protein
MAKTELHTGSLNPYTLIGIFFLLSFAFFLTLGNYILYFQETQSLFVFTGDYLNKFLQKPGALLEYSARFLSQFYHARFTGALIAAAVLTIPSLVMLAINKPLLKSFPLRLTLTLIPSCLLLIQQSNYYHLMEYNLGIIVILCCYLLFISSVNYHHRIMILLLFPVAYYLAGAYAFGFMIMYICHNLFFEQGKQRFIFSLLMLVTGAVTFFICWKVIFYQPVQQFLLSPLPVLDSRSYRVIFILLAGYVVFYPLICRTVTGWKNYRLARPVYLYISLFIVFIISCLLVFRTYNPQTSRVVRLEKLVFEEKWKEAVLFQEKNPARNLVGEYFYNIALSETDQLCDRLFFGPQDFLAGSLVLPWGDIHLNRGAYFYYTIGLMNEAHRWAYEEMVVFGYRPENIELLVKTSLINGDYLMARKYINILKHTIFYRKWALEFEKMADNPGLINTHPELGKKRELLPANNFFIQFNEPQNNLPLILEGQPGNSKAIEYYLAGLLLTKKVEIAVSNIINMKKSGYTRLPRHIEEAVMIYYNSKGIFPDLGGLVVSSDTQTRFAKYFGAYINARKDPATLKEKMQKDFGDTFWYYFHFK